MNNLVACLALFVVLFAVEYLYIVVAEKRKVFDIPHHQSSHTGVVVRGGGIIFYVAFLLWTLFHGSLLSGGFIGLTVLVAVSFLDDVNSVNPKIRLVCQFMAILLMFYHSGLISTSPHVILLLAVCLQDKRESQG